MSTLPQECQDLPKDIQQALQKLYEDCLSPSYWTEGKGNQTKAGHALKNYLKRLQYFGVYETEEIQWLDDLEAAKAAHQASLRSSTLDDSREMAFQSLQDTASLYGRDKALQAIRTDIRAKILEQQQLFFTSHECANAADDISLAAAWKVVSDVQLEPSPFDPLLKIWSEGFWPIGPLAGKFVVFAPNEEERKSKAEAAKNHVPQEDAPAASSSPSQSPEEDVRAEAQAKIAQVTSKIQLNLPAGVDPNRQTLEFSSIIDPQDIEVLKQAVETASAQASAAPPAEATPELEAAQAPAPQQPPPAAQPQPTAPLGKPLPFVEETQPAPEDGEVSVTLSTEPISSTELPDTAPAPQAAPAPQPVQQAAPAPQPVQQAAPTPQPVAPAPQVAAPQPVPVQPQTPVPQAPVQPQAPIAQTPNQGNLQPAPPSVVQPQMPPQGSVPPMQVAPMALNGMQPHMPPPAQADGSIPPGMMPPPGSMPPGPMPGQPMMPMQGSPSQNMISSVGMPQPMMAPGMMPQGGMLPPGGMMTPSGQLPGHPAGMIPQGQPMNNGFMDDPLDEDPIAVRPQGSSRLGMWMFLLVLFGSAGAGGWYLYNQSAGVLFEKASVFLSKRQWTQAEPLLQRVLKQDPKFPGLQRALGHVYFATQRDKNATEAYKKATVKHPKDGLIVRNLGYIYLKNESWQEALSLLQKATELRPTDAYAWMYLGTVQTQLRRYSFATQSLRKATQLQPQLAAAWNDLGTALLRQGYNIRDNAPPAPSPPPTEQVQEHAKDAEKAFQKAVQLATNTALYYRNLGDALLLQERAEDANKAYLSALQRDASMAAAFNNRGALLLQQGEFEEASKLLLRATSLLTKAYQSQTSPETRQNMANAYFNLAVAYQNQRSKRDEAILAYTRYTRLQPDDSKGFCNLGKLLRRARKRSLARRAYQRCLRLDPNNRVAKRMVRYLR